MFNVTQFELRNKKSLTLHVYCIGKVRIPDYFFSETFIDFKVKKTSRRRVGISSLIVLRRQITDDKGLVFCERNVMLKLLLRLRFYEIPFFVEQELDLSHGKKGVIHGYHKNLNSTELRKVRKFGYTYKTINDLGNLKEIYKNMYVPMMKKRHNSKAEKYQEFKKYFKYGYLLIYHGKTAVGFASLLKENSKLVVRRFGILNASKKLYSQGVMAALHSFLIDYALSSRFDLLSFGYSIPFLNSGVLIYKNKWGAKLSHNDQIPTYYLGIDKISSQMKRIFQGKPIIFIRNKKLGALVSEEKGRKIDIDRLNKKVDISFFKGIDFISRIS